jgi:phasin family protein
LAQRPLVGRIREIAMTEQSKFASDAAIKAAADAYAKGYEQFVAMSREQVKKVFPAAVKTFDDVTAFQKDYFETLVAASTSMAKGYETIAKQVFAFNQKAAESSMAGAKALAGCKTVQEAVELHGDLARKSLDQWLSESTKISELSVKVANEAMTPLNAKMTDAVEKFVKPMAA